jgi:hypothetical protein
MVARFSIQKPEFHPPGLHCRITFGRVPSNQQWAALRKLDETSMTLDEFCSHWELNNIHLGKLLGCDRQTIRRYLNHQNQPTKHQELRLGLVHKLWSRI